MATMPDTTAGKITAWHEAKKETHREHLGASLIGHHCDRYLWLVFRWADTPKFSGRLRRLFDTGKREEPRIYEELRAIGVELHTEDDGKQIECRDQTGHFGGSVDGIGKGFVEGPNTWAVLEIKTSNDKAFNDLRNQCVKKGKPQHYAQMQTYMGLMKLDRAMYICVNKNTDDLHSEWVAYDEKEFMGITVRSSMIVLSSRPKPRISEDPANWQCKMCDMHAICHQEKVAEFNCRTCVNATAVEGGKWVCEMQKKQLGPEEQSRGCDAHMFIPDLVPAAEPIDASDTHIEYKDKRSGKTFKNGGFAVTSRNFEADRAKALGVSAKVPFSDEIPF